MHEGLDQAAIDAIVETDYSSDVSCTGVVPPYGELPGEEHSDSPGMSVEEASAFNDVLDDARERDSRRRAEVRNWEKLAWQFARNAEYYRGLLKQIADSVGPEAYRSSDGSVHDEPDVARLPELVRKLPTESQERKSNKAVLREDVKCSWCGWPVLSGLCDAEEWDLWIYCSNKGCRNHVGTGKNKYQGWPWWVR